MPGINESRRPSKPPTKETCFFSLFYIKSILHLLCIMRKLCGVKPKVYKQNYLIDRAMDIFERGRIQSKMWNCLFKFLSFGFWFSPGILFVESPDQIPGWTAGRRARRFWVPAGVRPTNGSRVLS